MPEDRRGNRRVGVVGDEDAAGGRRRPKSPVVHLVARQPRHRSAGAIGAVHGAGQVAQLVGAKVPTASPPVTIGDMLAQDIPLIILAFVGVGLFVRRSPREAAQRLGWMAPRSQRWWLVAVGGIFVFLAVAAGIELLAKWLSPSSQQQVTNATNVLFSQFNNPLGIVLLGVLPAFMEETLFRGALLPRLGLVVTTILFAALHTQYAISFATLEVFVLGMGLGWLRVWTRSTLPCMVTHAGYDIAVGLLPFVLK